MVNVVVFNDGLSKCMVDAIHQLVINHHKFWIHYLIVLAKDLRRNTEIIMMLTMLVTE